MSARRAPRAAGTRPVSRFRIQWRQISVLTVFWLILVGDVNLVSVVGGALLAWLVTITFPLPPVNYGGRLHPWDALKLAVATLTDLAVASFALARFAFGRRKPRTGIVRVQLRSDSDFYQVITAVLVSIVPGTVVLDARQRTRTLYLHVFDTPDGDHLAHAVPDTLGIERRVVMALGNEAERAQVAALSDTEQRAHDGASTSALSTEGEEW